MVLVDVNVLVYAYREDARDHPSYRGWLERVIGSDEAYGVSDLVLSGFLRGVTHPRVFSRPAPVEHALEFVHALRERGNSIPVTPGPRHWTIFTGLCQRTGAKGNLVADAY